jgi:hypothetical protein
MSFGANPLAAWRHDLAEDDGVWPSPSLMLPWDRNRKIEPNEFDTDCAVAQCAGYALLAHSNGCWEIRSRSTSEVYNGVSGNREGESADRQKRARGLVGAALAAEAKVGSMLAASSGVAALLAKAAARRAVNAT